MVIKQQAELANDFKKDFDAWWDAAVPLMINEGLPRIKQGDYPLVKRYNKQLTEGGIPDWSPNKY